MLEDSTATVSCRGLLQGVLSNLGAVSSIDAEVSVWLGLCGTAEGEKSIQYVVSGRLAFNDTC